MKIAPPFGYSEVVAFQKTHKVRLPQAGEVPAFVRQTNAIPLSFTEFQPAIRDYPVVFATGDQGKTFVPVAVLGMGPAENLLVAEGRWQAGTYVPAYVRRYPFCMARVENAAAGQPSHLVCVEKAFLDDAKGEALFDAAGAATPRWGELDRLLSEFEADLGRTREMCAILADYGLLEPFSLQATLPGGAAKNAMHLTGMHRVNDAKLENLNAAQLKNLLRKGVLARIYMHLLSLGNFSRLLERKASRAPA